MLSAYAVEDVRAAEARVMADPSLADGALMQRAAGGLADVLRERIEEREARSVVVLVGPGDNGADALYAAALVAGTGSPSVTAVSAAEHPHPAAAEAARAAGVLIHQVTPSASRLPTEVGSLLAQADVVLDGLLGIGGRPGLRAAMAQLVAAVPSTAYVIAVDLPSGTDPAGEQPLGATVIADETVTFGVAKPVHLLPATEPAVGRLTVVDIGVLLGGAALVESLEPEDVARLWPVPGPRDDKYSRGVLGVVAGGERYPGAAVLTVTAAVESGGAMVRYVGPPTPTGLVIAACPEVVPRSGRVQAWTLGPGVDAGDSSLAGRAQAQAVADALATDVPCVVDAGALDLWSGQRDAPTLATPHAGELARLLTRLGDGSALTREQVSADPVGHARRAADLTGATVLLKGATTVVAGPGGGASRVQRNAPGWLATAGAGDVLAGLAGVLLASGLSPLDAGSLAALVHGAAAGRANPGGPVRALAVAHAIPGTVAHLLQR